VNHFVWLLNLSYFEKGPISISTDALTEPIFIRSLNSGWQAAADFHHVSGLGKPLAKGIAWGYA
jgi:hypothetical protein